MTKWTLRVVVLGTMIAGVSLHAHHSLAGVYTLGKEAKITGTFKSFRLVNPHSGMKVDVKNPDGTTTEWAITAGSVSSISRFGLREGPNALNVGDEVTVTIVPAADGKSPIGLLVAITYKDGHTVRFRSPDD